jgi:hypothetical protein
MDNSDVSILRKRAADILAKPLITVIWIRRYQASDIIVRFDSTTAAKDWGRQFLLSLHDRELRFCIPYDDPDFYLGATSNLHVQWDYGADWYPSHWVGPQGTKRDSWNERGTLELSPEEAMQLGALGEPKKQTVCQHCGGLN